MCEVKLPRLGSVSNLHERKKDHENTSAKWIVVRNLGLIFPCVLTHKKSSQCYLVSLAVSGSWTKKDGRTTEVVPDSLDFQQVIWDQLAKRAIDVCLGQQCIYDYETHCKHCLSCELEKGDDISCESMVLMIRMQSK